MGRRLVSAIAVAAFAFAIYHRTLLAGFDFGDTGFFQATVGSPTLTPRDGYPLYFAIGNLFVRVTRAEAARALNLASAVEGAVACGILVIVAEELSGSLLAAIAASLLFAVSFTFWSQAIIAEVYALHILFVSATVLLLLAWAARPAIGRLALFFAVYAIGFGNHLSMVLLLPGFTVFLFLAAPGGWRSMLRPRIVLLAAGIAAAGALQYTWNLAGLWQWPNQPPALGDALRTFWFDVTKSDWRETMILRLPTSMLLNRAAMYRFDLGQQFGWAALLAPLGLVHLFAVSWRRGVLLALLYGVNVGFAFTYNVGDTHVFYLPSHLIVAMLIAPGIVFVASRRRSLTVVASAAAIAYAGVRAYHDFPALDRSRDDRPTRVLAALTSGLDDQHSILLADLNWQLVNGLAYFGKAIRPDLAYAWLNQVLLYAPALIGDNLVAGRDVALTERANALLTRAYGPLFETSADPRIDAPTLAQTVKNISPGTRYVLCLLRPSRDLQVDDHDLAAALRTLAGSEVAIPSGDYAAIVGAAGRPPVLSVGSSRPFRRSTTVDGVAVEVRMESWLEFDTIRRMGFAQVVAAHRHTLIAERGLSFAEFDRDGTATVTRYYANIFALQPRFLVTWQLGIGN